MGVCSYCMQMHPSEHDECYSWSEAKGHCNIDGLDDPQRKKNKKALPSKKDRKAYFAASAKWRDAGGRSW